MWDPEVSKYLAMAARWPGLQRRKAEFCVAVSRRGGPSHEPCWGGGPGFVWPCSLLISSNRPTDRPNDLGRGDSRGRVGCCRARLPDGRKGEHRHLEPLRRQCRCNKPITAAEKGKRGWIPATCGRQDPLAKLNASHITGGELESLESWRRGLLHPIHYSSPSWCDRCLRLGLLYESRWGYCPPSTATL